MNEPAPGDGVPGRLVFVTPRYPPFVGGTEVHTAEVARRLRDQGLDVHVLTTDTGSRQFRDEVRDGVPVRVVPSWPRRGDLYLAPSLGRHLRALRADIVHVQGYHTFLGALAMWQAGRRGTPYVVTFHSGGHSSRIRNLLRPLHQRALGPLFRQAAALIAVSEYEATLFSRTARIPRHRIRVIPSGGEFSVVPRTAVPAHTVITSVGRLERYKGHHKVIRCLPHLLARRPDTELRIVGTGPYEARLRRLVASLDLEDHVSFTSVPASDRERLVDLLASSSLVTVLSSYESQGLVAFEALAMDVPVMVLESTALQELASAGLAAAVPPKTTPEGLASLIDQQLRHPVRPNRPDPPGWNRTVSDLLDVYRTLTDPPPAEGPADRRGLPDQG